MTQQAAPVTQKDANNEDALTDAIKEFARKAREALGANPRMHGSIALTLNCAYGQIKTFKTSLDETTMLKT